MDAKDESAKSRRKVPTASVVVAAGKRENEPKVLEEVEEERRRRGVGPLKTRRPWPGALGVSASRLLRSACFSTG